MSVQAVFLGRSLYSIRRKLQARRSSVVGVACFHCLPDLLQTEVVEQYAINPHASASRKIAQALHLDLKHHRRALLREASTARRSPPAAAIWCFLDENGVVEATA